MFNTYKKYNTSFIEVILERLKQVYDIELKSDDLNYIKDETYKRDYLKYSVPGSDSIEKLIAVFEILEGQQFLLTYLPLNKIVLTPSSKDGAFDELVEGLNFDTKKEIIENKDYFIKQMGKHDPYNDFPLLFKNKTQLIEFFLMKDEEIAHYFIGNTLLFPINMNWFMHFDYDLYAIHFAYKNNVLEDIERNIEFKGLVYSANEVEQLINDAND